MQINRQPAMHAMNFIARLKTCGELTRRKPGEPMCL
jgi:hypothetical protein